MAGATADEIRERNDIVDLISGYVALTKAGNRFKALCPFHSEKTPSFTVNREKQVWYCFGCHEGGNVFTFVQKMEKLSFPEAAELLAKRVGLTFARKMQSEQELTRRQLILQANARAAQFFHDALMDSRARQAQGHWQQRGIDDRIIETYRLGFAADSWDALTTYLRHHRVPLDIAESAGLVRRRNQGEGYYDYFRNRLMVPIRDVQGQVIAFGGRTLGDDEAKYINSPESETFSKGKILFGLDLAAKKVGEQEAAIVVEGYMDQIALYQYGFENCVATMGTAITPDHLRALSRYTRNLFVAFDADSAGMNAVLRSAPLFEERGMRVRIVQIPEGLDPDDFVRQKGTEAFQSALNDAVPLIEYRIRQATLQVGEHKNAKMLSEDEFRVEMIRAVVPVLLEIRSPVERESLIVRLAQEWCAPDFHRVGSAEKAIRQELEQVRRQTASRSVGVQREGVAAPTSGARIGPAVGPPEQVSGRGTVHQPRTSGGEVSRPPVPVLRHNGLVKAERDLMAAMLQGHLSPDLLERLPPERFVTETDRRIAQWMYEVWSAGEEPDIERWFSSETSEADPAVERVVAELLVRDTAFLDAEGAVDDRIESIVAHWTKLEAKSRRDAVARRIDAGEQPTSEELSRIPGGSGNRDKTPASSR